MLLPLVLILIAILAAAVVAYGTQPGWAEFQHGLQVIVWSRRLQWPLVTLALVLCVALIALVISGRRRAWWLIGLGPVLALFVHWLGASGASGGDPSHSPRAFAVVENPNLIDVSQATAAGIRDEDWVVGLSFGDTAYAYPYAALFRAPVILQSDHDRRMILLWSAYANRVLAFEASRALKARDLEFVSMPANAPLLYNSRLGQFINGLKGQTLDGQKPAGFGNPIAASKMTWRQWRGANPSGKVMWPGANSGRAPAAPTGPTRPIAPAYAARGLGLPPPDDRDTGRRRVTIVGTTQPAVVDSEALSRAPLNLRVDGRVAFAFRGTPDEPARAFSGQVGQHGSELTGTFQPKRDAKRPDVMFRDEDTGTLWNAAGVAVAGPKEHRGKRLTPVVVDDGVDWAVLKYWYPELQLHQERLEEVTPQPKPVRLAAGPPTTRPASRRRPAAPTTQRAARRKPAPPATAPATASTPSNPGRSKAAS